MPQKVGYGYLIGKLELPVFPLDMEAVVRPVRAITRLTDEIAVPANVAPQGDDLLEHLLFALKHEGCNLQVLSQAVPKLTWAGRYFRVP